MRYRVEIAFFVDEESMGRAAWEVAKVLEECPRISPVTAAISIREAPPDEPEVHVHLQPAGEPKP